MRYGTLMFVTDLSMGVIELASAVEDRGFDSFWLPEHTHIPVSRRSPYRPGGPLPEEYRRPIDPLVGLAAAAASTRTLRLGTSVMLAAQRDPVVTAKAIASLDLISDGRVTLGIGFGWNQDEMETHGVDYRTRRQRVREHVLTMQSIWRDDEAKFEGEMVRLAPSWSWPKPVQQPRPPILLGGGAGPKMFAHIAEYADGWIPSVGSGFAAEIPKLRRAVELAGRDPDQLQIVPLGPPPDDRELDHLETLGITEWILPLPSGPKDVVLPALDRYKRLVEERT